MRRLMIVLIGVTFFMPSAARAHPNHCGGIAPVVRSCETTATFDAARHWWVAGDSVTAFVGGVSATGIIRIELESATGTLTATCTPTPVWVLLSVSHCPASTSGYLSGEITIRGSAGLAAGGWMVGYMTNAEYAAMCNRPASGVEICLTGHDA